MFGGEDCRKNGGVGGPASSHAVQKKKESRKEKGENEKGEESESRRERGRKQEETGQKGKGWGCLARKGDLVWPGGRRLELVVRRGPPTSLKRAAAS